MPVDVVLAGPGLEDQFFDRVESRDVDGVPVRLASPEDIIVMKVLAGRPKDVDDVTAVVAAYATRLDRAYIEATLSALEQGLGQSNLRPAFRAAIERAGGRSRPLT